MLDRPGVHLGALLLAVVDDLDPRALEQAERVAARPTAELDLVGVSSLERLDQFLVAVDADLLAPRPRVPDVAFIERRPGGGLDEPGRLGERTYLMSQQLQRVLPLLTSEAMSQTSPGENSTAFFTAKRPPLR